MIESTSEELPTNGRSPGPAVPRTRPLVVSPPREIRRVYFYAATSVHRSTRLAVRIQGGRARKNRNQRRSDDSSRRKNRRAAVGDLRAGARRSTRRANAPWRAGHTSCECVKSHRQPQIHQLDAAPRSKPRQLKSRDRRSTTGRPGHNEEHKLGTPIEPGITRSRWGGKKPRLTCAPPHPG